MTKTFKKWEATGIISLPNLSKAEQEDLAYVLDFGCQYVLEHDDKLNKDLAIYFIPILIRLFSLIRNRDVIDVFNFLRIWHLTKMPQLISNLAHGGFRGDYEPYIISEFIDYFIELKEEK